MEREYNMESSNHEPPINVIEKYHSDIEKAWEMVKKEPKLKEILKKYQNQNLKKYMTLHLPKINCIKTAFSF